MDADNIGMKAAFAVIIAVLAFLVYKWWKGQSVEKLDAPMAQQPMVPTMPSAPPQDPVPQGPGITMYGNAECPWCLKQKDYFTNKKIEYTFVDCSTPGSCPNFVHGFPTIVKDGRVMPGYQEL